jgi:hypothetical protein
VRNFKFCRNKKFCSVKSRFPGTILALYRLFLRRFQWNFQVIIFSCAKFRWKISKNKICHFWQAPLAATGPLWNMFLITEWIALKLKILTDIKIRFKKKRFHNRPSSFGSRDPNVCDRTKKMEFCRLNHIVSPLLSGNRREMSRCSTYCQRP